MEKLDNKPYHSVGSSRPDRSDHKPMRTIAIFAASLLTSLLPTLAQTSTNTVREMSLQECVQQALANNFDVQIGRFDPRIAGYNFERIRASYYDPVFDTTVLHSYNSREGGVNPLTGQQFDPTISESTTFAPGISGVLPTGLTYDFSQNIAHRTGSSSGSSFDFYDSTAGVSLRQPLLKNGWIDLGRQNILIAKKDIKISEETYRQQLMDIATRVEKAYYELIFAREKVRVQEKAMELAGRLLNENRRRVEVGALAPLDEKQAQSQAAKSKSDLLAAQQDLVTKQNDLKGLILNNFRDWHDVVIVPSEKLIAIPERFDLQESWRLGVTHRPELLRLKLDLERRDIILRYQRNQLFPSVDLTGSYGHNGKANDVTGVLDDTRRGDNPSYTVGVVFSIPLSLRGPKNALNATKAEKEQALLRYKKQEQDILVGIENAIGNAQSSFQRIKASAEAREYAEAALQAEQKKLETGKSTSFNVLQLQRDLTERRSEEIRALADYNEALAEIALQEGTTLDRNHFAVSFK